MDASNLTGTFWLPGSESAAVYGNLVFDPAEGSTLTLAGGLAEVLPDGGRREALGGRRERIFGVVDRDGYRAEVTLDDCLWLSSKEYYAHYLLIGGHFPANDTAFDQVIVRLRDLPPWVAQDALTVDVDPAVEDVDRRELVARLDRPPVVTAPFTRGELRLDFRWSRDDVDYEELTIGQWPQFELHYAERTGLPDILTDSSGLRSLLTFCTDRLGAIEEVKLYRSDYPERVLSGDVISGTMQKIQLLTAFGGVNSNAGHKRLDPHKMLVSFEDVGGITTAATWLDEYQQLKSIIGSLGSVRADIIFGENRFLNVCSAAEGFHRSTIGGVYMDDEEFKALKTTLKEYVAEEHRAWFSSVMAHANDPSLNQRLKALASRLGTVAPSLVGDVAAWGKVVSTCRNELTHLEGGREQYESEDLYWLAEGVFNVTRLCLLLHVGLDPALVPKLARSRPIQRSGHLPADVAKRLAVAQRARQR